VGKWVGVGGVGSARWTGGLGHWVMVISGSRVSDGSQTNAQYRRRGRWNDGSAHHQTSGTSHGNSEKQPPTSVPQTADQAKRIDGILSAYRTCSSNLLNARRSKNPGSASSYFLIDTSYTAWESKTNARTPALF
jgi:hypothetical protein